MIKPRVHTTSKGDAAIEKLRKAFGAYPHCYVTIGVHSDAGKYTTAGAPDVVEVALWNEFGTKNIPARSFVQATVDEHRSEIEKVRNEAINNILEGKMDFEKALEMIGFRVQVLIQNKIKSNIGPEYGAGLKPNPPWKIAALKAQKAKHGVVPNTLIDSGLLLRSIGIKVYLK